MTLQQCSGVTPGDVTYTVVSVTSGGPATLREATTDVTFAEILDFLPVLPCPPPPLPVVRDGPEQTRVAPLVAAGATLYTLIAF